MVIYGDFTFVVAQPFDHFGIGELLGRLAEDVDVDVDEISHNASVDSDSTGTKKPFPGQASQEKEMTARAKAIEPISRPLIITIIVVAQ